jgi:hypothetical protein
MKKRSASSRPAGRARAEKARPSAPTFETGDLNSLTANGWVLGHFGPGPRHSEAVEVKWAHHERGSLANKPWGVCETSTTLGILISGRFEIKFRYAPEESVVMATPGQYVIFGPGIPHKSEALEDSVFLTIRWPSVLGDCKEASREHAFSG